MIGLENSRHPINQSDTKLIKTIGTWSFAFSRASSSLLVNLSSNWLMTFALFLWSLGLLWYRFFDTQLKGDFKWVCIDFASKWSYLAKKTLPILQTNVVVEHNQLRLSPSCSSPESFSFFTLSSHWLIVVIILFHLPLQMLRFTKCN